MSHGVTPEERQRINEYRAALEAERAAQRAEEIRKTRERTLARWAQEDTEEKQ